MDPVIAQRCLAGAAMLGDLWREGQRCTAGWAPRCTCTPDQRTTFCEAKELWIELAPYAHDWHILDTPFGIIEAMTLAELEATRLNIRHDMPSIPQGLGPDAECSFRALAVLQESVGITDPDVARLLEDFPKAEVVEILELGEIA